MAEQLEAFDEGGVPESPTETLTVEGDLVRGVSPEGRVGSMKLVDLIANIAPRRLDTCEGVLPDGVKCVLPIPSGTVVVHQTAPRVHNLQWIAEDSKIPFGPEASYRDVSIALPYLIVLAVFDGPPGGMVKLGNRSEAFFAKRPLDRDGLDTKLFFPALLNCSRFPDALNHPLSWICVQHLERARPSRARKQHETLHGELRALLHHLLESGFNLSSEHHEMSSWYSETVAAKVDPRIASVEEWERASAADPLFALEVPWLESGHTLRQLVERIAETGGVRRPRFATARDLFRVVFQQPTKCGRTQ